MEGVKYYRLKPKADIDKEAWAFCYGADYSALEQVDYWHDIPKGAIKYVDITEFKHIDRKRKLLVRNDRSLYGAYEHTDFDITRLYRQIAMVRVLLMKKWELYELNPTETILETDDWRCGMYGLSLGKMMVVLMRLAPFSILTEPRQLIKQNRQLCEKPK